MNKRMKVTGVALIVVLALLMSACSGNTGNSSKETAGNKGNQTQQSSSPEQTQTDAPLEEVELTWYYPNTLQSVQDIELVQAEMNKIVKEKINASIKLMPLDWGAYDQKMNVMTGAGEEFDLMFTAPWSNNYFQNVSRGALLPLDDLLVKHAPALHATVPESVWDATRVNGKIYGAINWQIIAMPYGVVIDKKMVEKYNINMDAVNTYEDLEPYLAAWNEPFTPLMYAKDNVDPFSRQPTYFGMDSIGEDSSVGWIRLADDKLQVVNQYTTDEFKQFTALMHKWYNAGYFPKDAALHTSAQNSASAKAGQLEFFAFGSPIKPGVETEMKNAYQVDVVAKPLSEAVITTNRAIATMTGISSTSKNPERAMMFLELINTDKNLYNLISNGIEGVHYTKVTDNVIQKSTENTGYNPNSDWMFGNQFNAYYTSPDIVGIWELTHELNLSAKASPLIGFSFDPEPVKTELAQTSGVYQQYKDALLSGTADPGTLLPEFLEKLQQSGAEKIISEKQRQIDEWLKNK